MKYQWEDEGWYLRHKSRWDALELRGWEFRRPPQVPNNRVGITIFRDGDEYTMFVPKTTPQEAHEELLERCEYHAANYNISSQP